MSSLSPAQLDSFNKFYQLMYMYQQIFLLAPNSSNNDNATIPEETSIRLIPRARTNPNPMQCGTFTLKCKDAEGACNNACYHIKCVNAASRTKVYVGTGQLAVASRNRLDSGNTAASNSVCRSFPFSQLLIEDQVGSLGALYQSDEWVST